MKKWTAIALCLVAGDLVAAGIDTTGAMICAPGRYTECTADGCEPVDAVAINGPRFIMVDVEARRLESMQGGAEVVSEVDHVERVDGKLVLQGVEDGVEGVRDGIGYSLVIGEASGDMVLSAATDGVSFVAFGACTNLP